MSRHRAETTLKRRPVWISLARLSRQFWSPPIPSELNPSEQRLPLGLAAGIPTLAETLHAVGFRTLAVANNPFLAPSYGMARGFDVYDFDSGASNGQNPSAEVVVQRALELVDDVDGQPFFIVVL